MHWCTVPATEFTSHGMDREKLKPSVGSPMDELKYLALNTGGEALLEKDPVWAVPTLWRSELRNILSTYIRQEIIDLETACGIQTEAESLIGSNEYSVGSTSVLTWQNLRAAQPTIVSLFHWQSDWMLSW